MAEKGIQLDDILVNELGQFGKYQLTNLFLVSLPLIMSPFPSEFIFSAAAIPHRCRIPECGEESKHSVFAPEWLPNAIPKLSESTFSSCQRYSSVEGTNLTINFCPANLFQKNTTDCENFVYARDNTVVYDVESRNTKIAGSFDLFIVRENYKFFRTKRNEDLDFVEVSFDLGCREWLRVLAGTLSSVGSLLVLPITGYISDRFGRRVALIISTFNLAVFGLIRAFSVNYPMYLVLQLLQTTLGGGVFSSAYVFGAELVGPKYRVLTAAVMSSMFSLGLVVLGIVAWLIQPWRYMTMALHIPCFLIIIYYWILSESVRWLLSKEKYEDAKKVLQKVATVNRTELSEKSLQALINPPSKNKMTNQNSGLIKSIFKSRVLLRRVCTTPIWWITTTFVYYGLSINSTSLTDTMYLNFILTVAIEIPGIFTNILVLDRIGRKPTIAIGFFFSAACNIAFAFISKDLLTLRMVLFLLGKYGISIVFSALYLYTSELYPTEYRHSLLGFSSMIGRVGSITAPLTPVLMQYWPGLPSMMFGVMGFISGVLVLTQPETLGTKLPDTLAEAEALGKLDSKIQQTNCL